MSTTWDDAQRDDDRRRRELASLQERRLADFTRALRTTKLDLSDVQQVPREISVHEYTRDSEADLDKVLARAVTQQRATTSGGYDE